ncbi:hypothetical protein E4U14_003944 [Claviceps sp. LM454 group G7]|nr:hypothetical protein E4U14_003944 [Claviceps sp. LM454 group G7]
MKVKKNEEPTSDNGLKDERRGFQYEKRRSSAELRDEQLGIMRLQRLCHASSACRCG